MKRVFDADHFLVAYIDVVGQSNKLLENSSYPPNQAQLNKLRLSSKEASEYIMFLREALKRHFRQFRKLKDSLEGLSEKKKKDAQRLGTFSAEIRGVSDSIIVSVPLENKVGDCVPVNNILGTLQGICLVYAKALASGKPVRGGVDVGYGTRLTGNEVYGSALAKAYKLETKEADYPRVVIGEALWKYVNYVENAGSNRAAERKAKELAGKCTALVSKDQDGKHILDVFGRAVKESDVGVDSEIVEKGYQCVVDFQSYCKKKNDARLGERYRRLRAYCESRLELWGVKRQKA